MPPSPADADTEVAPTLSDEMGATEHRVAKLAFAIVERLLLIGMVAVFYTGRGSPFAYPIFIAITALSRLIVLQGKEMAPQNIVFEAAAIILLALSATIIVRLRRS